MKDQADKEPKRTATINALTWRLITRQLDALYVVNILGWRLREPETKTGYQAFTYKADHGTWVSEMLPYVHDNAQWIDKGTELLRREGIFIIACPRKDNYRTVVGGKVKGIIVDDTDVNFARMAVSLLAKGISHVDIQSAWNNQDDWSTKEQKRREDVKQRRQAEEAEADQGRETTAEERSGCP